MQTQDDNLYSEARHESDNAFEQAIGIGRLHIDKASPLYYGLYMYMGTSKAGKTLFKHINTRAYL